MLARLAVECYYRHDLALREGLSAEAVDVARPSGDAAALADALNARHVALWTPAHPAERLAIADELIALARRSGEPERELQGRNWRFVDLMELGRIEQARAELDAHEALAARLRMPGYIWYGPAWRAMLALHEGRLADAEHLIAEAREVGERAGEPNAAFFHWLQSTSLDYERGTGRIGPGDVALLEERIRDSPASVAWRCGTVWHVAELGDLDWARAELEWLAERDFPLPEDMNLLPSLAELAMGCLVLDERRYAERLYARILPYAGLVAANGRIPDCYGSAELFAALLAMLAGRDADADAHFAAALEVNARLSARPWESRTALYHAQMLLARGAPGDRKRAGELLRRAGELARAIGQRRVARAVAELEGSAI
jgi:hypothetical protein